MELAPLFEEFSTALLEPFSRLAEPADRFHWPYILSSVLLAVVVYAVARRRQFSWRGLGRFLLSPKFWLHPSSRFDAKVVFINAVIRAFLITPWMFSAFALAVSVVGALDGAFGPPVVIPLPRWGIAVLYTVVLFILWDGSRYLLHRLCHEIPALWEFHKVHHSAEVLTPMTLYRVHPVESTLFAVRGVLVTGFTAGLFFYLFRSQAVQLEMLGANAAAFAFNLLGANLRHSQVWLTFGRFERWFLSPAQHQIHHSAEPTDFNKNYGTWLALWDRLGGTFVASGSRRKLQFGLHADDARFNTRSVRESYLQPFSLAAKRIFRRRHVTSPAEV
jgi:sterol desaturase/sphingolipid hydroxylase (fatty acid hydroxylase superfamily)